MASGTISGEDKGSYGSLLELTWRGSEPLDVAGEERTFLRDGDAVTLRARAERDGVAVDFGEVTGRVVAAGG